MAGSGGGTGASTTGRCVQIRAHSASALSSAAAADSATFSCAVTQTTRMVEKGTSAISAQRSTVFIGGEL